MEKPKLFNKNFTLLWLGQSVSQLGTGAGFIGLLWWVQMTTGSALALGTLAMVQTLIAVALAPIAGALVDRLDRKGIIVATDVIRGVTNLALGWLALTGQLTMTWVYVLASVNAVCNQFFNPAIAAAIPLLVPNERLEQANSLNQVSINLVNIIGFSAGGVLVAFMGIPFLLLANGLSFLVSAFSELFITIPALVREKQKLTFGLFGRDIKEGLVYVMDNKALFKIMQVAMVLNFFSAPIFILLPLFVASHMGAGSEVYGFLMAAQMAGAFTATMVMSTTSIVKSNLWIVRWGISGLGLAVVGLVLAPANLWGVHIALFGAMGVLNASVNVYFGTVLQRATKPEFMGKVFGLLGTVVHGLQPLSQGLSGLVAEFVRLPIIYAVCGGSVALGGIRFGLIPGIMPLLRGEKAAVKEAVEQPAPATG